MVDKLKFEEYVHDGMLDLNGKKDAVAKSLTFFKDMVNFLNTRPDIKILNLSNLDLGSDHIREFREVLEKIPLPNITVLNLSDNPSLCEERDGESGIKAIEKLTKQHLPSLNKLTIKDVLLFVFPDQIKKFEETVKKRFPESLTIDSSFDSEIEKLRAKMSQIVVNENSKQSKRAGVESDNTPPPPAKRGKIQGQSFAR